MRPLLLFASLCLFACASPFARSGDPAEVRILAGRSPALSSLAREVAELLPGDESGAAIALVEGDRTSLAVAGPHDWTEETLFELGSITKIVTTQLIAGAALEGALDLDQSIDLLLPDAARGPQWRGVSVRHLCTHSSGLSGWPPNLGPVRIVLDGKLADPFGGYGQQQLIEGMRRTDRPRVGTRWRYSNYGFAILGLVLEQQTGQSYAALARERVLDPFGMDSATLDGWSGSEIAPPRTHHGRAATHWSFEAFAPAGALRGSLRDAVALLEGSMLACKRAGPASLASCLAQQPAGFDMNEASGMGLGWVRTRRDGEVAVWHNGGTGGYSTFLGFHPESRRGVVILTNVEGLREIDALALDRLLGPKTPPEPSGRPEEPSAFLPES